MDSILLILIPCVNGPLTDKSKVKIAFNASDFKLSVKSSSRKNRPQGQTL